MQYDDIMAEVFLSYDYLLTGFTKFIGRRIPDQLGVGGPLAHDHIIVLLFDSADFHWSQCTVSRNAQLTAHFRSSTSACGAGPANPVNRRLHFLQPFMQYLKHVPLGSLFRPPLVRAKLVTDGPKRLPDQQYLGRQIVSIVR